MGFEVRPLHELLGYSRREETGEFICATSSLELHVYLQFGKVAWATVSNRLFEFSRFLMERSQIEEEVFRQVVEDCRRDRRPLGETLVELGLASWDAVREALGSQMRHALEALASVVVGRTVFLPRPAYSHYRSELTFSLDELLSPQLMVSEMATDAPTPLPASNPMGVARQLVDSVAGVAWVEIYDDDKLEESMPPNPSGPRVPLGLVAASLADGADFVGIRSVRGSLLGVRLRGSARTAWCRLTEESTFGAAVSTLWSLSAPAGAVAPLGSPALLEDTPWEIQQGQRHTLRHFRLLCERAPEIQAALVVSDAGEVELGIGRQALPLDRCLSTIARRRPIFDHPLLPEHARGDGAGGLGYYLATLVVGEPAHWCFGAELDRDSRRTLWLFADRRVSQGLGWAFLASLSRNLVRNEEAASGQAHGSARPADRSGASPLTGSSSP